MDRAGGRGYRGNPDNHHGSEHRRFIGGWCGRPAHQRGPGQQRLAFDPQAPVRSQYTLDRGMASVSVLSKHDDIFVQPGDFEIGIMPGLDYATLRRCASQVEVNTGSSWHTFCALGDCTLLAGFLGDSSTQTWQIRVTSANGRSSEPVTRLVIADSVAPSVQIATTGVLSGTLAFVRGIAWDDFPTTRAQIRWRSASMAADFIPPSFHLQWTNL